MVLLALAWLLHGVLASSPPISYPVVSPPIPYPVVSPPIPYPVVSPPIPYPVVSPPISLTTGTCSLNDDSVEDCLNFDCGSCGNSCCMLRFRVADDVEGTMNLLKTSFDVGGPDGEYTWLPDHLGLAGFRDDRPRGMGVAFVGLLSHRTSDGDIQRLNIAIVAEEDGGSRLDITSMSQTSACDGGQNYKNIFMAMRGVPWRTSFKAEPVEPFCQLNGTKWTTTTTTMVRRWASTCWAKFSGPPGYFSPDTRFALRCCSSDGSTCSSPGCKASLNHSEAELACEQEGLRLCTKAEYGSAICCSTGCSFDKNLVWTSTA
eukprot:TRINITY_DN29148_c1_g2_i1.p1 TRINITY_DN29148_c1_g2~~TRINITY_DN29148_c1_g2_i1.p1  ORF type:complete len:334 (+),score=15.46 TRINITY_DN29148_c1_g2_i1:54-1004(+)